MLKRLLDTIWQPTPTPKITDESLIYVMIISGSIAIIIAIAALAYYLYKKNKNK